LKFDSSSVRLRLWRKNALPIRPKLFERIEKKKKIVLEHNKVSFQAIIETTVGAESMSQILNL